MNTAKLMRPKIDINVQLLLIFHNYDIFNDPSHNNIISIQCHNTNVRDLTEDYMQGVCV